ncbi:FkbM family methyltransferase [Nonlabens sp.]|uniref:FkbM family methyltransferase n=1 Tax=Nonlabens sp. TaxID=1888209 RepID=UPI003F69562D
MTIYRIKRKILKVLTQQFNLAETPKLSNDLSRRKKILNHCKINKILDIGANSGQYAVEQLNKLNYKGDIVSFEPMKEPYDQILVKSELLPNWKVVNIGIGLKKEKAFINVAKNSFSSSLLEMLPSHSKNAPQSIYINKEEITIDTLSNVCNEYCSVEDNIYLKVDTQGYEYNILESGRDYLKNIKVIQIEMSIIPLYLGEKTFEDMLSYLKSLNFKLVSIEPGFYSDKTGQLLQVDGIFINEKLIKM